MLNAKLVVVGGDAKSGEVQLKLPTVIGRGKEAGLTVPHALVSRRHAEIFEKEGSLFVRDLGSLNGTFVNDRRIETDQPLEPNQLLTLGNVTFRAVYELNQDTQLVFPNNETVEFDPVNTELPVGVHREAQADDSASEQETEPVHKKLTPSDETVPVNSLGGAAFEEGKQQSSAAATPEPLNPAVKGDNNVFSIEDEEGVASQSVSISSLGNLPERDAGISFAGGIDLGKDGAKPASRIESVDISLGADGKAPEQVGDSGLGSFLNKFPK